MNKIRKTMLMTVTAIALTLAMALPAAVFATDAPPPENMAGGTFQAEFRYLAGETPDIPQEMTRFGFVYRLVSVSDPVLEGELPAVRTYTYRIDGALSEEQVNSIAGLGSLKLTEVYLLYEEQVDVVDVMSRPTNDVEEVPEQKAFTVKVASLDDPDRTEERVLDRVGVTFSDLEYDQLGRPAGYTATAVYRGVQTYRGFGYYLAEATFVTYEDEPGDEYYVVVASYATDGMLPPIDEEEVELEHPAEIPVPVDQGNGLTALEDGLVALQSGNPIMDIMNGLVPMGGLGVRGLWSFLSLIMAVAAVGIAAAFSVMAAFGKRRDAQLSEIGARGDDRRATLKRRGMLLGFIAIALGLITLVTWMILDTFGAGMVWINENTALVGILLAATAALCIPANIIVRKALSDDEGEGSYLR